MFAIEIILFCDDTKPDDDRTKSLISLCRYLVYVDEYCPSLCLPLDNELNCVSIAARRISLVSSSE